MAFCAKEDVFYRSGHNRFSPQPDDTPGAVIFYRQFSALCLGAGEVPKQQLIFTSVSRAVLKVAEINLLSLIKGQRNRPAFFPAKKLCAIILVQIRVVNVVAEAIVSLLRRHAIPEGNAAKFSCFHRHQGVVTVEFFVCGKELGLTLVLDHRKGIKILICLRLRFQQIEGQPFHYRQLNITGSLHTHPRRALGDDALKVVGDGACSGSGSRSLLLGRLYRRSRRVCGRTRPLRLRGNDHQAHEHHHAHEQGDCSLPKVTFHCLFLLCIYFFRLISDFVFCFSRHCGARSARRSRKHTGGIAMRYPLCRSALRSTLHGDISLCRERMGLPDQASAPQVFTPTMPSTASARAVWNLTTAL